MTVSELIKKLGKFPQNLEIYVMDSDGNGFEPDYIEINSLETDTDYLVISE